MLNLTDIQQQINKILTLWFEEAAAVKQSRLFKQALYAILGINAIYFLWDADVFFGADSIISRRTVSAYTWHDAAYVLYYFPNFANPVLVLIALITAAGIAGKRHVLSDILLLLLQINLHNAVYAGLSGGHELVQQLLIFNCGISMRAEHLQKWWQGFIHRFSVTAVQLQLCVVYLIAGLSKCTDAAWQEGGALYSVMQVQHFSFNDHSFFSAPGVFTKFLNYAIMAYQLCFPILIWFQRWRKPLIIVGSVIYLFIGFGMGLVFFAAVMITTHLIFWPMKRN